MKVLKSLLVILLLLYLVSRLWASEPGIGWIRLSANDPNPSESPISSQHTSLGNNIYLLMATYDYSASTTVYSHESYDLGTKTWTNKANMNVNRSDFRTAAVNDKIYAIGGKITYDQFSNVVEEYDPVADTWTIRSPLPVNKSRPEVVVLNNKIYVIGGYNYEYGININSMEEYDPATDNWTVKASLPDLQRDSLFCLAYDNKIYAFSIKSDYLYLSSIASITLEIYDPLTDAWESKATVPLDANFIPKAAVLLDNKIYLVSSRTYLYDPANNNYQYLSYCDIQNMTDIVTLNNSLYTADYYGKNLYVSVFSHQPVLANTGEAGYEQDVVEPNDIKLNNTYTFKVRYFDEDNEAPAPEPRLHIELANSYNSFTSSNKYFTMQAVDPQDTNYVDGKDYYYIFKPEITDGWLKEYSMSVHDQSGLYTFLYSPGELEIATTEYPYFSPIEVSPKKGFEGRTMFTFRVKYTDPNNLPPSGQLRIQLHNIDFYVLLYEEDHYDTDYSDGKYYAGSSCLYKSGQLTAVIQGMNQLWLAATEMSSDTFTVVSSATTMSDLSINNFNSPEERICAGLPFENFFWIYNAGTAGAEVEAEYYLSPTKSLTDAYQLKILAAPAEDIVPENYHAKLTYSVFVPAAVPPGDYFLGVVCKADNALNGDYVYWDDQQTEVLAGTLSSYPEAAFCYPSPAYLSKGDKINFALVPADSEISIMMPSGDGIKKFTADSNGYVPPWDGATDHDGLVGSGIYLVYIDSAQNSRNKLFKILIFR